MKHALVVGGTGMLSQVSLWLLKNDYHVSIIARNAERMNRLLRETRAGNHVTPLLVDYRNDSELKDKVNETVKQNGPIDIVVAWIHSGTEAALDTIATEVSKATKEWELFHVLGSSADLNAIQTATPIPNNCKYHQVQLGFVDEGSYSRWLTNKEISEGVIEAIKQEKRESTIGQI